MNREQRIRRLLALRKIAAVYPPKIEPQLPEVPPDEEERLVQEFLKKQKETGAITEKDVAGPGGVPYSTTEAPEERRGPLSERETELENRPWKTYEMAETPSGTPDYWVGEPDKVSTYETYFGLKTPSGWRPTPISDLLYKLSVSGQGNVVDPSRGSLVPPKQHPYHSRFGPLPKQITPLKKEIEDKIIMHAPAILNMINVSGPVLSRKGGGKTIMHDRLRADTTITFFNRQGMDQLLISDTRNTLVVPLSDVSAEMYQDIGSLNRALGKSVENYPELSAAIESLTGSIKADLLKEQYKINASLRFRGKSPEEIARVRDIMVRTIIANVTKAIKEFNFTGNEEK